ncbi:unnamed protein product [Arctia plantaginis]|uniref:Uncharacterized protein n=1 Tax=Arctia plantaginis TaxID=874455 RepID=A0A8S0Z5C2_ARCPL|nr:unnamed protein product [Arctia plantaginis]
MQRYNRYPSGIFSLTNCRDTPTVSQSSLQQRATSVNRSTIWPVISPKDVCHSFKLDCGDPAGTGCPDTCVFGRLSTTQLGSTDASFSGCGNAENIGNFGKASQLREVSSRTVS